ncbi:hypothetical protein LCGC14_2115320 [marine sediment metagenome]|uniref:Uncharacterized protein n=1 Tax=marine sediment metagenome TaxID=412755 RepID=A0A0F9E5W5_9ZZZZ
MSEYKPTLENLSDPYVLQLIMALSKRDDEIEILMTEGKILKTAIAEIAGQKLLKEMSNPEDGDYELAYETMVRVARYASDRVQVGQK